MKVIYASRTGNVEVIAAQLDVETVDIHTIAAAEEDFILMTYTDGAGDVPFEVESFLSDPANVQHMKGVIVSGDPMYGEENYCGAGDRLYETYGTEVLYRVENAGTEADIAAIRELVK